MENQVGYRFHPTDVEIVDVYLRPKNLDGDTSDVDRIISTLNMCSFDPWELPPQSVIQSSDQTWYYFGRIERKFKRGDQQIRKTKSGFWKKTGKTIPVIGKSRKTIGEKRVLVFHYNKSKTNWVMHEYHLSPFSQMMTYTMCKVKFKGAESEIYSPPGNEISLSSITDMNNSGGLSSGSDVGQSQQLVGVEEGITFESLPREELENPRLFSGFLHLEEEAQLEDAIRRAFNSVSNDELNNLFNDVEHSKIVSMQEDCNNHRPKKPVTGVMIDHTSDDSDFDSVSPTTISIQTWSTCDSFGSSNNRIDEIVELQQSTQASPNSTIKLVPITQEVSQALDQVNETGEGQETIKKKRAGSFYRIIQKFFKKLNLCSSI